jgi:CrcB protein
MHGPLWSASRQERLHVHKYFLVGVGGFAGAISRYWVGTFVTQRMGLRFPYGTFLINVSGCFLIGFFMHLLAERGVLDLHWLYVVVIGFIGAYTTFSTFEYETMRALQDGQTGMGLLYVGSSVLVGFFMVWLGSLAAELVA